MSVFYTVTWAALKKIKHCIKINCDLHQQKNREQNANVGRVIHKN